MNKNLLNKNPTLQIYFLNKNDVKIELEKNITFIV